jgi:hypothetical protein
MGRHDHQAAVAEAAVDDLRNRRHAVDQDDLVAPVEVTGVAGGRERPFPERSAGSVRSATGTMMTPASVFLRRFRPAVAL